MGEWIGGGVRGVAFITCLALRAEVMPADKGGPAFLVDRSGVVFEAVRGVEAAFLGPVAAGRALDGVLTGDEALFVRLSREVRPSGGGDASRWR